MPRQEKWLESIGLQQAAREGHAANLPEAAHKTA
jgi:hypothetical protein